MSRLTNKNFAFFFVFFYEKTFRSVQEKKKKDNNEGKKKKGVHDLYGVAHEGRQGGSLP